MDIRTVIGVLLGLYGIILTITGLVKGSDAHADLVSGMCLLVAGAVFLVWVRLRPVKVPEVAEEASESAVVWACAAALGPAAIYPIHDTHGLGRSIFFLDRHCRVRW
jgi:drug/metabolite transporter (DMT)-like permease